MLVLQSTSDKSSKLGFQPSWCRKGFSNQRVCFFVDYPPLFCLTLLLLMVACVKILLVWSCHQWTFLHQVSWLLLCHCDKQFFAFQLLKGLCLHLQSPLVCLHTPHLTIYFLWCLPQLLSKGSLGVSLCPTSMDTLGLVHAGSRRGQVLSKWTLPKSHYLNHNFSRLFSFSPEMTFNNCPLRAS